MSASFASPTVGEFCVSGLLGDALNIPKCFWPPGTASIYQGYFGTGALAGYGSASLVVGPSAAPFSSNMLGVNVVTGSHIVNGVRITNGVDLMTGGTATVATGIWKCLTGLASINAGKIEMNSAKGVDISTAKDVNLSGSLSIQMKAGSTGLTMALLAGSLTGTWNYNGAPICAPCPPSDFNLKKDIQPIENALDKILQLQGVSFKWDKEMWRDKAKENPEGEIGVIAQEVEKVVPEVVREFEIFPKYYEKDKEISEQKITVKGVKYENLVALLIEGMKEQQKQIDDLKEQIKRLS